jgi:tetratricopeptide (TPR) repeat protein
MEHDNLATAIRYGLARDRNIAARIAAACWPFWKLREHASVGRAWLARVLEDVAEVEPGLHAELLLGAADLAIDRGDLSSGADLLARARSIAESHRDGAAEAGIVAKMATLAHKAGNLDRAIGVAEEALALARRAGDDWTEGRVLCGLALLREDRGDRALAGALAEDAVESSRRCGDPYLVGDAALSAGEIALNRDDHGTAERRFGEALRNAEDVGLADVRTWSLAYLGKLAVATGDARRARALLERALAEFEELETPMGAAWAHCQLGRALVQDREHLAARRHLEEALRLADAYVRPDIAQVIDVMALLALDTGEMERAAILTGAAEALRSRFGLHRAGPEARSSANAAARLAAALPAGSLEQLIIRGKSMTDDEVVAFALAR